MDRPDLTVTLTADDLEQIEEWYGSAAGESATRGQFDPAERPSLLALLQKLGFELHSMDQPDA